MSLIFKDVEDSPLLRKATYKGATEFVNVSIDPSAAGLPFPGDYEYSSCFLPKKFQAWSERIQNFEIRDDDVLVVGFPKSGTTWLTNIVWQLVNGLDFTATIRPPIYQWIEHAVLYEGQADDSDEFKTYIDQVEQKFYQYDSLPSPRIFKTHLPAHLLPKAVWMQSEHRPKIIYVCRNPKGMNKVPTLQIRSSFSFSFVSWIDSNRYSMFNVSHDHKYCYGLRGHYGRFL